MKVLRTPDDRFVDLPDFDFEPNYLEIDSGEGETLRVHYLDEGPTEAPAVLLMHGEPSWCFLYRHMIPVLVEAGHRVIAPDLIGFGRSDKPSEKSDYTYARHVEWMRLALFERLDLNGITLFGQDWGGLIGLRLVAAAPERFARVVIGNTGLPTGHGPASDAFLKWQEFSRTSPHFPIGAIINGGCTSDLSAEVIAAYDAPFPDDSYTAGARIFPSLVRRHPTTRRAVTTRPPGRCCRPSTDRSCSRSATAIRSPVGATRRSSPRCRERPVSPTPPSLAAGTSSRRIAAPSWRP
jgi:haloalkane dehalogenase